VTDYQGRDELEALAGRIDAWLAEIATENPAIASIDRGTSDDTMTGDPRWFVRMRGEEKDITTVWLTLGQRTLRYETYVMPAPEENAGELYEQLLRRNERLVGAHFAIGIEDAVFLRGELPDVAVTAAEIDRILGTLYATVEQTFRGLLRIGFASRLND
jgi:hypothetical protein